MQCHAVIRQSALLPAAARLSPHEPTTLASLATRARRARRTTAGALTLLIATATLLAGCAGRTRGGAPVDDNGGSGDEGGRRTNEASTLAGDAARVYRAMGLITGPEPLPFVGEVGYFASASPDSALTVVTLSLPNRVLTFAREGERYRATYEVRIDVRQSGQVVRHVEAAEIVRVASLKETQREDESVIFQQIITLPPGRFDLDLAVRDAGSSKSSTASTTLAVPRFVAGTLSSALAVYEAAPRGRTDSLPDFIPSPRSSAAYGRDTVVRVYLEGYGVAEPAAAAAAAGATGARLPLRLAVRNAQGGTLWSDTTSLVRRGQLFSGVLRVPVARIGIGPATLVAARTDTPDSARSPLLVSFGDDLPIASFEEMLSYLRFFSTPQRLRVLRDTTPEARAAAWSLFLRETDPNPATPQNEALTEYFNRLRQASLRFRDEGSAGWMSDRGRVYLTLGEPDQVYEQGANDVSQRGRVQIWEYREYRAQLVFVDQTGFSRWRLTSASAAEFESIARRILNRGS